MVLPKFGVARYGEHIMDYHGTQISIIMSRENLAASVTQHGEYSASLTLEQNPVGFIHTVAYKGVYWSLVFLEAFRLQ